MRTSDFEFFLRWIMRFFVPTANDPAHARMLYNRIRDGVNSAATRSSLTVCFGFVSIRMVKG